MVHRSCTTRAFTVVELITVVAVASIIMSIGVAAYISMNKDLAWQSSVSSISSLLHACRNSATTSRTPVSFTIRLEPAPEQPEMAICTEAYATLLNRVGTWHFEEVKPTDALTAGSVIEGAFGQKAAPLGMVNEANLVRVDGKCGKAIQFLKWIDGVAVGEQQAIQCDKSPAYDVREGIRLSAWIKPELPPDGLAPQPPEIFYPIVAKPFKQDSDPAAPDQQPVYFLMLHRTQLDTQFRLLGGVRAGKPGEASLLFISATEPMIRPGAWTHVSMIFCSAQGSQVRLFINDDEVLPEHGLWRTINNVNQPEDNATGRLIAVSDQPLMIGCDGIDYFNGTIDEVMIDAFVASDRRTLPANVLVSLRNCLGGPTYRIDFDRSGRLATTQAGNLPLIALCSSGTPTATFIGIELTGAVKTWNNSKPPDKSWRDFVAAEAGKW